MQLKAVYMDLSTGTPSVQLLPHVSFEGEMAHQKQRSMPSTFRFSSSSWMASVIETPQCVISLSIHSGISRKHCHLLRACIDVIYLGKELIKPGKPYQSILPPSRLKMLFNKPQWWLQSCLVAITIIYSLTKVVTIPDILNWHFVKWFWGAPDIP